MGRSFQFAPEEFYHVYNRGVEKRDIYLDPADYHRFVALLYLCNSSKPVHLQLQGRTLMELISIERGDRLIHLTAYCLMPNHFHLLIKEAMPNGISKFIQKLSTGYTMYFNKRYERSGSLFQGKFKATHADDDTYLQYLLSYIHLNPVKLVDVNWKKAGIADTKRAEQYLNSYQYSSFLDYMGVTRIQNALIDQHQFPNRHKSVAELEQEMRSLLNFKVEP